jgi:putative DNA primase/helicase
VFGQWLAECCEAEPGNDRLRASAAALRTSWAAFAKAAGLKPETDKAFAGSLQRRGFVRVRTKAFRGYAGIALRSDPPNPHSGDKSQ